MNIRNAAMALIILTTPAMAQLSTEFHPCDFTNPDYSTKACQEAGQELLQGPNRRRGGIFRGEVTTPFPPHFSPGPADPVIHGPRADGMLVADVRIIDGDTFEADGIRFRLWGIDAPERNQLCVEGQGILRAGALSTTALEAIIGGREMTCEAVDIDRCGRVVARCFVGSADIGAELVAQGWAWDYGRYSDRYYRGRQRLAAQDGLGVWGADCMPAWQWRRAN